MNSQRKNLHIFIIQQNFCVCVYIRPSISSIIIIKKKIYIITVFAPNSEKASIFFHLYLLAMNLYLYIEQSIKSTFVKWKQKKIIQIQMKRN